MLRVPGAEEREHLLRAGPLRVRVTPAGEVRVGWDEADWLGPGRLTVPDASDAPRVFATADAVAIESSWITAGVRAMVDEPVVVLRLEARSARDGLATGDFATPAVGWHFDPANRDPGGAPEDLRGFGHQYTEF